MQGKKTWELVTMGLLAAIVFVVQVALGFLPIYRIGNAFVYIIYFVIGEKSVSNNLCLCIFRRHFLWIWNMVD